MKSGRGFSLVEVLVVVVIILILTSIAVPLARSYRERARTVNCSRNLRQIGLAVMMYAGDNQMTLPVTTHQRRQGGKSWTLTLQPYTADTLTFKCADDPDSQRPYTYLINDFLTPNPAGAPDLDYSRLSKLDQPHRTLMFAEASPAYSGSDHFHFSEFHGGPIPTPVFTGQVGVATHAGHANYLFADGHVETLTKAEALARLAVENSLFIDPSQPANP